jgi:hypothetical protein
MAPHDDRMQVVLRAGDFNIWLNGTLGAAALRVASESALHD